MANDPGAAQELWEMTCGCRTIDRTAVLLAAQFSCIQADLFLVRVEVLKKAVELMRSWDAMQTWAIELFGSSLGSVPQNSNSTPRRLNVFFKRQNISNPTLPYSINLL